MKPVTHTRGSIMIWTLVMGIALTSVFFFFAQRLGATIANQRSTMEYLNAQAFAESYADYLEHLPLASLQTLKGTLDFNGLTGTLTNELPEITGALDTGQQVTFSFADTVKIKWNLCVKNLQADLTVVNGGTITTYPHHTTGPSCNPLSPGYDDTIEPVILTNPFTLKSLSTPLSYSIVSTTTDQPLLSNEWKLEVEMPVSFGRRVVVKRVFIPST